MRRTSGVALVALGLVLVFLSPLAAFYITPRVRKLPLDVYDRNVSDGTGTYLNGSKLVDVGPAKLRDITIIRGDVKGGSPSVAVWDAFDSTIDIQNHHELSYSIDRYTLDRRTGVAVKCCGQNRDRTGSLTLTFPFGTKKRDYWWWDQNSERAYPIRFQGVTKRDGLTVYHFHQHVAPEVINHLTLPGKVVGLPDQPSVKLDWWYTSDTDVLVEPTTGAPVRGSQVADQWLADASGTRRLTIATTDISQNEATVRSLVDYAKGKARLLRLLEFYIPWFGWILGLAVAACGVLLLRRRRGGPAASPAAEPATVGAGPER